MEEVIPGEGSIPEVGMSLRAIMGRVKFSVEQMSRICGVSRRQLSYWTKKGILPEEDVYSLSTLEKVLLIKKDLDNHASLRWAVPRVEAYLRRRETEIARLETLAPGELRQVVAARVDQVRDHVDQLRRWLSSVPAGGQAARLAAELDALDLEAILQPPDAHVTLTLLALRLGLMEEKLASILSELPATPAPAGRA